jgi:hypothetical protein
MVLRSVYISEQNSEIKKRNKTEEQNRESGSSVGRIDDNNNNSKNDHIRIKNEDE